MKAILVLLALLAGCTTAPVPPPQVPARLQVCPDATYVPPIPPSPRTVKRLFDWSKKNEQSRQRSEALRRECSNRLNDLNLWILNHMAVLK